MRAGGSSLSDSLLAGPAASAATNTGSRMSPNDNIDIQNLSVRMDVMDGLTLCFLLKFSNFASPVR